MSRLLPILFLLFAAEKIVAQCGYTANISTNKDYCVGSSLTVNTTHPLERIVWYKDGLPFDSTLANQSLAATPSKLRIPGVWPGIDITSDESGNVYTLDAFRTRVIRWNPASNDVAVIGATPPGNQMGNNRLFVDHADAVYMSVPHQAIIIKYLPGSTTGQTVITGKSDPFDDYGLGLFVDCQGNAYVADNQFNILKWAPGAADGVIVAGGNGYGYAPNQLGSVIQFAGDSLNNLMIMNGGQMEEWPPGASSGTNFFSLSQGSNWEITDFCMDGKDTCYTIGFPTQNTSQINITKWAPAMSSQQVVGTFTSPANDRPQLTMDNKGNIFAIVGTDSAVYEFKRTSTINSTFTPTTVGQYYAVVTDMRGYAARTNPITINPPSTGTPSISINATATATPVCTPITFTAAPVNPGLYSSYQWMVSGVKVGDGSLNYSNSLFADSDQVYCIMLAQAGCQGPVIDTSNIIQLAIDPHGTASVKIRASKDSLCLGDTALFTAIVTNGSNNPTFQWQLNGIPTADDSSTYSGDNFSQGDVLTCLITSDDVCGLAKSNSIQLTVSVPPTVESGQLITIVHGQSTTLEPVITGDANTFLWTPGTGLSDSTIENPVASPDTNTLYTLKVTAAAGCKASGTLFVNVYTPLSVPTGFTPNNDGRNDIFYVLGGPINSRVEEFEVFDRWGAAVFQVHGVPPGDRSYGWNGQLHGSPAPAGTYAYVVVMKYGDGHKQVYKGTVILIR